MTTTRRAIQNVAAAPPPADNNIITRINNPNEFEVLFLETDGSELISSARAGEVFKYDSDANLVGQISHNRTGGNDYGALTCAAESTFAGGDTFCGSITYVGGVWKNTIYKMASDLTVYASPQKQYDGSTGGASVRTIVRLHGGSLYSLTIMQNNVFVLRRHSTADLTQTAIQDLAGLSNEPLLGFIVSSAGVYVAFSTAVDTHFTVIRLDLDLNIINRGVWNVRRTLSDQITAPAFHRNGSVYFGTITRNSTQNTYDATVWKIAEDLSTYNVAFCEETNSSSSALRSFGVVPLANGNLCWAGVRRASTGLYELAVFDFDDALDIVSQFKDTTNDSAIFGGMAAIGNTVYVAKTRSNNICVMKFGVRDFPTATQPSCDAEWEFVNTSYSFSKTSGSLVVDVPTPTGVTQNEEATAMTDSVLSRSVTANCEF